MKKIDKFKDFLLNLIYPKHLACIFCDEELDERAENDCCYDCLHSLPFIDNACLRCGAQISDNNENICLNCKINNFYFDIARAVFKYENAIVSAIHRFKYANEKYLYEPFGKFLSNYLASWNINFDFITSIPLHPLKEKSRAFNQSKLIAKVVSNNYNIPYMDMLEKIVNNASQASLPLKDRKNNVKDVFKTIPSIKRVIKDKNILLIDDVFTSGSTVNEASKMLRQAGVNKIYVLTLAHTVDHQEI